MHPNAMLFSLIGGSGIVFGALLAGREHIRPLWLENEFRHSVTAFGGGALLSAIALVLIPEGIKHQSALSVTLTFLAGGIFFMQLDRYLDKRKTAAAQFMAMVLDFIPEAVIIGSVVTKDVQQALLLAIIIFIQNVPESFNAFCEITSHKKISSGKIIFIFSLIGCSAPVYALIGSDLLNGQDQWLARLMTFCAGGILYILFNDIAPQAKLKHHWWPSMGALLGFLAGVLGEIWTH